MRAIGVTEFGGPEALRVVELPDPQAGPGEVRIRVHAAAVNPTDTGLRSGARAAQLKDVPPPYVPGMDVAGVLDQIGPQTPTDLRPGEHVMAIVLPHGSHGGYSELIVLPAESVVRVPAGASDAEAATLPMNGLTTVQALDLLSLEPGQVLAVTGAAGAVGGYAVQLGRAAGLRVIADASEQDEQLVKDLGADLVVRARAGVRRAGPRGGSRGADGLVDAALLDELAVPAVRDGGRIATVRGFRGAEERGITFYPVPVRNYAREQAKLDRLRQQVEARPGDLARGPDPARRARRRGPSHPGGGRHARPPHPGVLNPGAGRSRRSPARRPHTLGSHGRDQGVSRSPSLYRKVAEDIKAAIAAGGYAAGTRLPSESELAERYLVSRGTIRQAFAALRADGVIASRRGRAGWSSAARGCRASASCCRSPAGPGPWARRRAAGWSRCSAGRPSQRKPSAWPSRPASRSTGWSGSGCCPAAR